MNKRILTACAAALALAACKETPRTTPAPAPISSAPIQAAPAPVVAASEPTPAREPAQEELGIDHEHRDGSSHLARAHELKAMGDPEAALIEARRALGDDPLDEEALNLAGKLATRVNRNDLALDAFGTLAMIREDDPQPLIQRARLLVKMKKLTEAIQTAQDAVFREPENPETHQILGRAYLSDGQLQPAIDSFQEVVALAPEHGHGLNNLGFALLRANRNPEAVIALARAAQLLPHLAYVRNNLGVAYERIGFHEEAKEEYAKATQLSPRYLKARINAERASRVASADFSAEPDVIVPGVTEPVPEVDMPANPRQ
jgi:Flp pilus assembly protein TadD